MNTKIFSKEQWSLNEQKYSRKNIEPLKNFYLKKNEPSMNTNKVQQKVNEPSKNVIKKLIKEQWNFNEHENVL